MIKLDKIITFSCPNECGQIAVPCNLRMILENTVFFCEACGCEFQAADFPHWLADASYNQSEAAGLTGLHDAMSQVYSCLYDHGRCPNAKIINDILLADRSWWKVFPQEKLSISVILTLLDDQEFVSGFDFSTLNHTKIVKLLSVRPDFTNSCDLGKLSAADWCELILAQPIFISCCPWDKNMFSFLSEQTDPPVITLEKANELFQHFPARKDFRFKTGHPDDLAAPDKNVSNIFSSSDDFFAVVNYFNFASFVAWDRFDKTELLSIFCKYPAILPSYGFTASDLLDFDWKTITVPRWNAIKTKLPDILIPVFELCMGRNVCQNLKKHPDLTTLCNWSEMNAKEWKNLLIGLPDEVFYREHCNWTELSDADWEKIIQDGKNSYAISVYKVQHGEQIIESLQKYPDLDRYVNWPRIPAKNWLTMLGQEPHYASKCPWQKIYTYISHLPDRQKESVKQLFPAVWEKRLDIFKSVDSVKLQELNPQVSSALIDFFDWEEFFDFSTMTSAARIDSFINHPQFGDRYGWEKLAEDEAVNILRIKPDYLPKFHPENFSKKFWRRLIEADEVFAKHYSLSIWDYLFYRKFNSRTLAAKITYKWHRLIALAVFCCVGYYLYDGPCGYQALWTENRRYAIYAALIYAAFAMIWSSIHAKLFAGRTPFLTTIAAGVMGGLLGAAQYGYTFFLTKISLSNQISLGVFGFVFFLLLLIRCGFFGFTNGEITTNRAGFKIIFLLHIPAVLLTVFLCHPYCHSKYLKIHELFSQSSRPFVSAEKYYLSKIFYSDTSTLQKIGDLENALSKDDYETSKQLFESIPSRYMSMERIVQLKLRLKNTLHKKQKAFTKKSVAAYNEKNFQQLYGFLSQADQNDAQVQFLLGQCFHFGLGGCKIDINEAVKWYRKAASQKNAEAMGHLGMLFLTGRGVRQSYSAAVQLLTASAELGNVDSQRTLAFLHLSGKGVTKNKAAACKLFLKAADQNDRISQREAAMILLTGADGIKADPGTAVKLLEKAVAQNDADAQLVLGRFYLEGKNVKKNLQKAISLLRSAANQNNAQAQTLIGLCFARGVDTGIDPQTAVSFLEKAANQNNIHAQTSLFEIFYFGKNVDKDINKALFWLRKAAENNDPSSQYNLGIVYWKGIGIAQNYDQAEYWLKKAASNGYAQSKKMLEPLRKEIILHRQKLRSEKLRKEIEERKKASLAAAEQSKDFFRKCEYRKAFETGLKVTHVDNTVFCNLAILYLKGVGTEQNIPKAIQLANKVVANNDPRGYHILAWCFDTQKDMKTAFKYYKKAAESGLVAGQHNLGCCYVFGHGCTRDYEKAYSWFLKAAEHNFADAENNIGYLYLNGLGVEKNYNKAKMWFKRAASHGSAEAKRTLSLLP